MSFTAQQERPAAQHPRPEQDTPEATPQAIKYRHDTSHYVAAMLTELRQIAGKAGFERLVTALDAAYYEAYAAMGNHARPAAVETHEKVSSSGEPTAPATR
jgi:hypothetical protein